MAALVLLVLAFVAGIIYIILTHAAGPIPTVGMYMSPDTQTVASGAQFTAKVYANTGSNQVRSMTAYIKYDPTKLQLIDANQNNTASYPIKVVCSSLPTDGCKPAGELVLTVGGGNAYRTTGNALLLGDVTFKALKAGVANVTFDSISGFENPDVNQTTLNSQNAFLNGTYTATDSTAPSVPGVITSPSKSMTSINLSWGASTDESGGSGLAGYKIFRGGTQVGTSTSATYTDTGLTPNTSYSYTVAAYDIAGNTSAQNTALAVTTNPDSAAPSTPGTPTAGSATMTTIVINWAASTDNVAVTKYIIYRAGTQIGTTTGATTYTDTGLTPGTSYSYTIKAADAANNLSATSAAASLSTAQDTQAPTAPTGLTAATPTSTTVGLSWTASTDNVAVTGYRVFRNGTQIATPTGTTYTDTPGTNGTISYTVKAVDAKGNLSAASNTATANLFSSLDLNHDGHVNISDLSSVLSHYGQTGSGVAGDVSGDGKVDITDVSQILSGWTG